MDNSDKIRPRFSGFARRSRGSWFRVTGSDALAFLQGQFTHELRPDRAPPVQYGLWLNQKGRVLADSTVLRGEDGGWWLGSDESPASVLLPRLEAYIIADDVVLEDLSAAWEHWLLAGEDGIRWLEAQAVPPPPAEQWKRVGAGFVYSSRLRPDAWELRLPRGDAVAPRQATLTDEAVEQARIEAGVPAVPRDVGPLDLPAEAGLEAAAVSFTKGCYLGQEVVARLKSMGRVRRRLMRVGATRGPVPEPGAALLQAGRRIGEVRSAVGWPGGGWRGLAMLTLTGLTGGEPIALDRDGPADIRIEDLPAHA